MSALDGLESKLRDMGAEVSACLEREADRLILFYDEIHECAVSILSDGAAMELSTPLMFVFQERERAFEAALGLSLHGVGTRGARIFLDGDALMLGRRLSLDSCDSAAIADSIASFIESARSVRDELLGASPDRHSGPDALAGHLGAAWA
jgi:hypothetical protein